MSDLQLGEDNFSDAFTGFFVSGPYKARGTGLILDVRPKRDPDDDDSHAISAGTSLTAVNAEGNGPNGRGVVGTGAQSGVTGIGGDVGVSGRANPAPGPTGDMPAGVDGQGFLGVRGNGVTGVLGTGRDKGVGVSGHSPDGIGVAGTSHNVGVFGAGSPGISGQSSTSTGVQGRGYVGVTGIGIDTGVHAVGDYIGLFARGNPAGLFAGNVQIWGDLQVFEGVKSAVVRDSSGKYQQLYCLESPESWFEDFGEANLENGKASVPLPGDFARLVETSDYHVFVTPYGDCAGLIVARRGPKNFTVREQGNGKSDLAFSFRIVAKRKKVDARRLAIVPTTELPDKPPAKRSATARKSRISPILSREQIEGELEKR